jgi:hypothetical protein
MSHGAPDDSAAGAADSAKRFASHPGSSDHESGCKSGFCKCPCAHAPAMGMMPTLAPSVPHHSRAEGRYRMRLAPECATVFFRPPI